jgi:hypothetical protein
MIKRVVVVAALFYALMTFCYVAYGYDNENTHIKITEIAAEYSKLNGFLKQKLGYSYGYEESVYGKRILDWLTGGSYLEDVPNCRAANHFHNPLASSWSSAQLTDQPMWIDIGCMTWKPFVSNVTWATGFLSRADDIPKAGLKIRLNPPVDWNTARENYYSALTANSKDYRDYYFAATFSVVGQVLHSLQDMSVPAHVRNDFQSHLFPYTISWSDPTKWVKQPYEKYVELNPMLITSASPAHPSFNPPVKLTDYWDTDTYLGNNPSSANTIGLAEFTNANYFSDNTILNNGVSSMHAFPNPNIMTAGYQICEDYEPDSLTKRRYISRKACPNLSPARDADHFAVVGLLDASLFSGLLGDGIPFYSLDDNVHNTYAKELLPRAVGYSAALLDYFFRGELEVKQAIPEFTDNILDSLTLKIRNYTSTKEALGNGYFGLAYQYVTDGVTKYGKINYDYDMNANGIAQLPYGKDDLGTDIDGAEIEIKFDKFPDSIKITEYPSVKFTLAYFGDLGAEIREKTGDYEGNIKVGGAVIGKVFRGGKILFNEEWDKGPTDNNKWCHIVYGFGLNTMSNNDLIMNNESLVQEQLGSYLHRNTLSTNKIDNRDCNQDKLLPIVITKDTYLEFKIDSMAMANPPLAPEGFTGQYQGFWLQFNNGTILQFSVEGQFVGWGDNTGYFEFTPGKYTNSNIYKMFQELGFSFSEPLTLNYIDFVQEIIINGRQDFACTQQMEIDFVRIVDAKPIPLDAP